MIEIAEGEKSPYVMVKPEENKMIVKGNSFMANPPSFYEKIIQWSQGFKSSTPFNVEITVGFYNTSTLKIMNMLLKTLSANNDGKLNITLFVEDEDEDQINTASTITFNIGTQPKIVHYT
jgi:hypothetical protein